MNTKLDCSLFKKKISMRLGLPFLSFVLILVEELLFRLKLPKNVLDLPWPGRQVIPSILYIRGELINDMLAASAANSPYYISAKILSALLPDRWDEMLAAYSAFSYLFKSISLWLSVVLIVGILEYIFIKRFPKTKSQIRFFGYTFFSLFIPNLRYKSSDPLWDFIHGSVVGGWDFPVHDSLNPSGISFMLVLLTLIMLIYRRDRLGMAELIAAIFFIIIATLLHPILPLYAIGFIFFVAVVSSKDEYMNLMWCRCNVYVSLAWLIGIVIVYYEFPQVSMDGNQLFDIYVSERHPHHYLPTAYLDSYVVNGLIRNFLYLGFLSVVLIYLGKSFWPLKAYFFLVFFLAAIHGAQYFLVERVHSAVFIIGGISRLSGLYNAWYCILVFYYCASILQYINWCNDSLICTFNIWFERVLILIGKVYILSISLALLLVVLLMGEIYTGQLKLIPTQLERQLRLRLDVEVNTINYEILSEIEDLKFREIGGLAVFGDGYFPFVIDRVAVWGTRNLKKKKFFNCLNEIKNIKTCARLLESELPIYMVTYDSELVGELIFSMHSDNKKYYVYALEF